MIRGQHRTVLLLLGERQLHKFANSTADRLIRTHSSNNESHLSHFFKGVDFTKNLSIFNAIICFSYLSLWLLFFVVVLFLLCTKKDQLQMGHRQSPQGIAAFTKHEKGKAACHLTTFFPQHCQTREFGTPLVIFGFVSKLHEPSNNSSV